MRSICLGLIVAALTSPTPAAVLYSTAGQTYSQTFNGPAGESLTYPWLDDATVPGWYAHQFGGSGSSAQPAGMVPLVDKINGNNPDGWIVLYLWRSSASATDYALGTKPLDATGSVATGLRLTNNTGQTLISFTLGYTGEQWHQSTGGNNNLVVSYQLGAASLADGAWTAIPSLEFDSPKENAVAGADLNGNSAANRVALAPVTIADINWTPGADLWIRWYDTNSSGVDQGLAIDDVTFAAFAAPEPTTATLGAIAAVFFAARRRFA